MDIIVNILHFKISLESFLNVVKKIVIEFFSRWKMIYYLPYMDILGFYHFVLQNLRPQDHGFPRISIDIPGNPWRGCCMLLFIVVITAALVVVVVTTLAGLLLQQHNAYYNIDEAHIIVPQKLRLLL